MGGGVSDSRQDDWAVSEGLSIGESCAPTLCHSWPDPHWASGHPVEEQPLRPREPRRKTGVGWGEDGSPKKSMGIQAAQGPGLANERS